MYDASTPIDRFLDAAAAKQPAPGGGSVTALVGALAASMGEMTLNYSVGKKGLEVHAERLKADSAEFHRARLALLQLMSEDQSAYEALTAARKLPPSSERDAKVNETLWASIRAPQTMAAMAAAVLGLCERVVDRANFHLLSDLAVCAELSMAAVRCAGCNVRVNLADITQESERNDLARATADVQSHATAAIRRIIPRIEARQAAGK